MSETLGELLRDTELMRWQIPNDLFDLVINDINELESDSFSKLNDGYKKIIFLNKKIEGNQYYAGFTRYSIPFKSLNDLIIDVAYSCNNCEKINFSPPKLEVERKNYNESLKYFCNSCNAKIYELNIKINKKSL